MTKKELRRLSKLELIELLAAQKQENSSQQEEIDSLRTEIGELKNELEKLRSSRWFVSEKDSVGNAALLSRMLEAARQAAEEYLRANGAGEG